MQQLSLRARIANLEDGLTERKQGIHSNDEIRKAVVSFANSVPDGRTAVLYIGVANDGSITGVAADDVDKVQQRVRRICDDDCFPPIREAHGAKRLNGSPLWGQRVPAL